MKLIEGSISKIKVPEGARDILVFDDNLPGFGVRKFASGRASFFVKYQIGSKQRKLTLGAAVPGTLAEMRKKASDVLARARLGQDVAGDKQAAAAKKTATVGGLIPKYLTARRDEVGARYFVEIERYLQGYWAPLHGFAIEEVRRQHIVERLDEIADEKGRVTADRAKAALGGLLAWAVERSYRDENPVIGVKRRANGGSRARTLTEAELVEVWAACGADDYGRIVRLLILTGQRRSEISELAWNEIDLEKKQLDLPAERTKNNLPHLVPLSAAALAIIEQTPPRYSRDFVFGQGSRGFQGWSNAKRTLDARINAARAEAGQKPMAPWTIHDLRRSFATLLGETKIAAPHIVEAILNHISGTKASVAGVYNKALYLDERREALQAWGQHVAAFSTTTIDCGGLSQ